MPGYLRQSTASQSRALGPFLDDTDFKTAETGLTVANTDIKLVVNGGASANKNSGGGTHRVNGVYGVTFDATDTATVGEMEVSVAISGALIVFDKFFVLEEAAYDALFAASAPGYVANAPVNVAQWSGTNVAAVDTAGYPKVTVKSGTGTGEVSLSSGLVRLSATGVDDILDEVVEGAYTVRQYLRGFASALLAKCSGMSTTTAVFRDTADAKNRISATVDADGNRTAIGTLDLT